jgi:gliding motility-associated protein GldM
MLGAYSKTAKNLSVNVGGQNLPIVDGMATYRVTASGLGEHTFSGTASYVDPNNNEPMRYEVKGKYMVGAPSAAVSLDKMNVFYIGVDNPITVSASGVPSEGVSASMSGGSMSGTGKGKYTVRVSTPGKATISVSAKLSDGKVQNMGSFEYRVKRIPDPIAKVGGKPGGGIPSAVFRVQSGAQAVLENFDFDARFEVTSFKFGMQPKRAEYFEEMNNGAYFNDKVKAALGRSKPGDAVYLDDIKAKGPDGTTRSLGSLVFKLQ